MAFQSDKIIYHYETTIFRVNGRVCCDGYKLNEITRQCESKCIRWTCHSIIEVM